MSKITHRGVKIKLYPNNIQNTMIVRHSNAVRWLWNYFVGINLLLIQQGKNRLSYVDMCKELKNISSTDRFKWLEGINVQVLQQTLKRLELALKAFSRSKDPSFKEFPRFKSRKKDIVSFTYPQHVKIKDSKKILLPSIGYVKFKGYREFHNMDVKQLIVKVHPRNTKVEATYIVECENQTLPNKDYTTIGLDMGVKKFVTDSDNNQTKPLYIKDLVKDILRVQKRIERAKLLNKKYLVHKLYIRLGNIYSKISKRRNHFLHMTANRYVNYQYVYVEDLEVKRMVTKILNPMFNKDGKKSKVKSFTQLRKSILEQGWNLFFNILDYKLSDRNSQMVKVEPNYTSQTCSCCGVVDKSNRNGEIYSCKNCNTVIDADYNAAINIHNLRKNMDVYKLKVQQKLIA